MRPDEELFIVRIAEAEVAGTITPTERADLDAKIAADPAFGQAYNEYFHTISSLKQGAERSRYKEVLREVHNEVTAPKKQVLRKLVNFQPKHWRTAAMAASVALLTSVITLWSVRHNEHAGAVSPQDLVRNLQQVHGEMESIKQTQHRQEKDINYIKEVTTDAPPAAPQSNYSGTGFAISNDGYFVTNYHVVRGAESLHILTRNGKSYPASVVAYEPANDIALLQVDDEDFTFSKKSDLPYSFLAGKASLGASVFTLGFPQDEIVYNEGYIASRNGYQGDSNQYRLEVPAGPGQSGAPVVDATGNIIGIIRSKDLQTENTGTTYAVSSKTLLRLLRDIPKDKRPKLPTTNHLAGLSRQQQIEKLQDFTCMVQVYKKWL